MTGIPFAIVDAFCVPDEPFTGNQAAVCVLQSDNSLSDETKQKVAAELNLSETAFVSKNWHTSSDSIQNNRKYTLRWFTPEAEVPLCGHATLATARALFETMQPNEPETTLEFLTKFKGTLTATMHWATGRISLDFPLAPPIPFSANQLECLPQLLAALIEPLTTIEVDSVHYSPETRKLLVVLHGDVSNEKQLVSSALLRLRPNFGGLLNVTGNDMVMGIIATTKGLGEVDFYSRYFAPWVGINEDPVTGSAHTVLAAYWSEKLNKLELVGKQCSKRSGLVFCKLNDQTPNRVNLEGLSKIVVRGELSV